MSCPSCGATDPKFQPNLQHDTPITSVSVCVHPFHNEPDDIPIPLLTRSACREQALVFRNTLTDANLDQDTIHPNDIPAIQLALTASLLYAVMALDQDRQP